jgi:hypothetical protein
MKKSKQESLSSIVTKHLDEGGDLFSRLFEAYGMSETAGMALVRWFGTFQREVERVGR